MSLDHGSGRPGVPQQPRTALVAGASGFVGRWLVMELLVQGVAATTAVVCSDRHRPQPWSKTWPRSSRQPGSWY